MDWDLVLIGLCMIIPSAFLIAVVWTRIEGP